MVLTAYTFILILAADEDFVAEDSESDVAEEFDSNPEEEEDDDDEE